MFRTIEWLNDSNQVRLVDQTQLPLRIEHIVTGSHERIAQAIETMEIRGAPAIGAAAAMGMALAAIESHAENKEKLVDFLEKAAVTLNTRPTAVNLTWATARMLTVARESEGNSETITRTLIDEAKEIAEEDVRMQEYWRACTESRQTRVYNSDHLQCGVPSDCTPWYCWCRD